LGSCLLCVSLLEVNQDEKGSEAKRNAGADNGKAGHWGRAPQNVGINIARSLPSKQALNQENNAPKANGEIRNDDAEQRFGSDCASLYSYRNLVSNNTDRYERHE
jgi:hypothetical protein